MEYYVSYLKNMKFYIYDIERFLRYFNWKKKKKKFRRIYIVCYYVCGKNIFVVKFRNNGLFFKVYVRNWKLVVLEGWVGSWGIRFFSVYYSVFFYYILCVLILVSKL